MIERLRLGNEIMKKRSGLGSNSKISPLTLKQIKRVKRLTKMIEKVATGVLSGVVKVSGFLTGSVANSRVGKKFFGLLPREIVLASLDGFSMLIISSPCVIYYNILAYISFLNGYVYSIKQLPIQKFINRCIIKSMKLMWVLLHLASYLITTK